MSSSPSSKLNQEWPSYSQSPSLSYSEEYSASPSPAEETPAEGTSVTATPVEGSQISLLIGSRIGIISGVVANSEEVRIVTKNGHIFRMMHDQDCCETVTLASFEPEDVTELFGALVVDAFEDSRQATGDEASESGTWTFYRIVTDKGTLVLRWLGESNGYYSESVEFEHIFAPAGVPLASGKPSSELPAVVETPPIAGVRKIMLD